MLALGFCDCLKASKNFYALGSPVDILRRSDEKDKLNFAMETEDDGLMTRYRFPNIVGYNAFSGYVDLKYDGKLPALVTGGRLGGIVFVSGVLSFNGVYLDDAYIICRKDKLAQVKKRISIIALGNYSNRLMGVLVVPALKGVYINFGDMIYSTYNGVGVSDLKIDELCRATLKLEDWFTDSYVKGVV